MIGGGLFGSLGLELVSSVRSSGRHENLLLVCVVVHGGESSHILRFFVVVGTRCQGGCCCSGPESCVYVSGFWFRGCVDGSISVVEVPWKDLGLELNKPLWKTCCV